jgi:hypothetical protein
VTADPFNRVGAIGVLREAPLEKLITAQTKTARRGNRLGLVAVAMFVAGVWLDWRWFPTALVPAAACCFYGYLGGLMRKELARRKDLAGDDNEEKR